MIALVFMRKEQGKSLGHHPVKDRWIENRNVLMQLKNLFQIMYSYQKALAQREESVVKYGLLRMQEMMGRLGNPEKSYPVIHVAGTNGKGSVVAMLESVLKEHGLRVGATTSPHLISLHERIRINGSLVTDEQLENAFTLIEPYCAQASHFELMTALAFVVFRQQRVDVAVVEVGMGGRLDATNIVSPLISIITSLALDHQSVLGDTLLDIAKEKAGIIKPGVPLVCAAGGAEGKLIDDIARKCRSVVCRPAKPKLGTNLLGSHQLENLALVEMALRRLPWQIPAATQEHALKNVVWPGRLHFLANDLLIDAAHNPHGMRSFCDFAGAQCSGTRLNIIAGFSADKDIPAMIAQLQSLASRIIFTPFSWKRTWNPLDYITSFRGSDYVAASPGESLRKAREEPGPWAVVGSLFLLGDTLKELDITSEDLFDPLSKVYKQTLDWGAL